MKKKEEIQANNGRHKMETFLNSELRSSFSEAVTQRCSVLKKSVFQILLGPRSAILLKKRLWHTYFPVNFAKFLRTTFLQNISGDCFRLFRTCHPLIGMASHKISEWYQKTASSEKIISPPFWMAFVESNNLL